MSFIQRNTVGTGGAAANVSTLNNPVLHSHKVFELVPFVEKLPLQIECLTCYENVFILGTSCGRMLINEVKLNETMPSKFEAVFEKSITATKRPILQLEAVKAFDMLIALFDSQLHVFDLDRHQLQYSINKTKGCSYFATSISSDRKLLRMVVSCKKKLQFYYVNLQKKNAQFMELSSDLELNDIPRNLKFTKDNLVVYSLRKDYYYYELPSIIVSGGAGGGAGGIKQPETRFSTGTRQMDALCEKLHNDFFTLGVDENKTILYDTKGKPHLEYPILWSSSPSAVCSVGPYLIGILPSSNSLEVMTIQPSSVSVQTIEFAKENVGTVQTTNLSSSLSSSSFLSNAVSMPIAAVTSTVNTITGSLTSSLSTNSNINLSPADKLKILKSNGNSICYIATQSYVWCLSPIRINDQLERIIRYKNYELGLSLISSQSLFNKVGECTFAKSWPDETTRYTTSIQKVLEPFFNLNMLLGECDTNAIRRIKNLNALDLFCRKRFSDSLHLFQQMRTDPSHIVAFVPGLLPDNYRNKLKFDEFYPSLDTKELESAIDSLIDYLQFKRNEILKEGKPLNEPGNFELHPLIDGRPVLKTRSQILQIIDTTLLKCYLKTKENLVPFFLRREQNFLHLEESERLLIQHNKTSELVILYEKKEAHEKALNLLMTESTKPNSCLFGLKHTVDYLKKLGNKNIELIIKYSKNVIEADPKWGMQIFMGDSVKIDEILSKKAKQKEINTTKNRKSLSNIKSVIGKSDENENGTSMLSVLLKINKSDHESTNDKTKKSIQSKIDNTDLEILADEDDDERRFLDHELVFKFLNEKIELKLLSANLVRIYLQYCIFVWNDKNANLNNALIDSYITFIENSFETEENMSNATIQVDLILKQINENFSSSKTYKQMLIYFLTETSYYEPSYALSKLDLDNYAEERAIVLGKLGKHHDALSIYVNKLGNTDKAEAYCENVFSNSDTIEAKQVYYQLLKIYLNSEYEEIRIGASIRLLNAHSNEIGSCRSLELLPAELMKCKNLTPFFENMLNRLVRNKHNTQIINRLMFALELQIHEIKIDCQKNKFSVNDEQICKECNKRMGISAMVRFPNGDLIHYGCSKNSEAFTKRTL